MLPVRNFLDEARYGFEFHGKDAEEAAALILAMREQDAFERFLQLLRLLRFFASATERTAMASPAYSPSLKEQDISRLDRVLIFLRENRNEAVALTDAADVAKMSPKSFCRFFKANTGKTLVEYLHELRVGEACRLLLESDLPVSEIAFECGFNNLSNFNRRFRSLRRMTPREYRKQYQIDPRKQDLPFPEFVVQGE